MSEKELKVDLEFGDPKPVIDDLKRKLSNGLSDLKTVDVFNYQSKGLDESIKGYKSLSIETAAAHKSALNLSSALDKLSSTDRGKGFSYLTSSAISMQIEADSLMTRLRDIRAEMGKNPSDALLKGLQQDAKDTITAIDGVNRKMLQLKGLDDQNKGLYPKGTTPDKGIAGNLKLSGFQKTNLSYQVNDVLTMAAMGANPAQILASQGGQIAQTFSPEQIAAFTAKYAGLVTVLGAGAAAIALTYKITGDMRKEAERLLKVEEMITGARNKQILSQIEAVKTMRESIAESEKQRVFNRDLANKGFDDIDRLKERSKLLQDLNAKIPAKLTEIANGKLVQVDNKAFTDNLKEIEATNLRIFDLEEKKKQGTIEAYRQNQEVYNKSQDAERMRHEEEKKRFNESIEKSKELRESIKDVLISSSDNPLTKLMVDFESATEKAEKRFGQFGSEIVKMMADIDKSMIQSQINQILYDGSKKALQSRQQADRLGSLPETETDQFGRRLGFLDTRAENALRSVTRQRAVDDYEFYAKGYNPNNPKSAFQNKFGNNISAFSGETKQILEEINAVKGVNLDGTGAFGKGLLAEKLDSIITMPQEELLKALERGGGDAFNAQKLLNERANIAKDLQAYDKAKFENNLAKDKAEQQNVRDAESLIKNLGADKGLTDPQKIKEFLAITGDLGTENLTPELLRARQQALRTDAANTAAQAKEAATQAKIISETMNALNKQLTAAGLKVTFSETPIVDIEVHDGLSATQRGLGTRANNSNVRRLSE